MTVRIGITGPIGCGKSTVAGWLAARPGVVAVDADRLARDVLAIGHARAPARCSSGSGPDLARPDGSLDRGGPRAASCSPTRPPCATSRPSSIPPSGCASWRRSPTRRRPGRRAVVIEAIKLVEGGLAELCDEVWLVTCDPAIQLERLLGRGSTLDDAQARITAQGDLATRLRPRATRVIDTSGTLETTRAAVEAALDAAIGGGRRRDARRRLNEVAARPVEMTDRAAGRRAGSAARRCKPRGGSAGRGGDPGQR